MSGVHAIRRSGGRTLLLAAASVLAWVAFRRPADGAFTPPVASRRQLAVSLVGPLAILGGSNVAGAVSGISDIEAYVSGRKKLLLPAVCEGYCYLESKGADKRFQKFLPTMVRKMELYSSIFSREAGPLDRQAMKLVKLVGDFERLGSKGDQKGAMEVFKKWQDGCGAANDAGYFDPKDKSTYDTLPDEDEAVQQMQRPMELLKPKDGGTGDRGNIYQ